MLVGAWQPADCTCTPLLLCVCRTWRMAITLQHSSSIQHAHAYYGMVQASMLCVLRAGVPQVSPEERERAKRVVYGIVYGQTPWGLAQQLEQGVSTAAAQGMIDSFLARFQGGSHSHCHHALPVASGR